MFRFVSAGLFVLATLSLAGCSSEPAPGTENLLTEEAKAQAAKANADPKSTDPKAMMGMMQPKNDPSARPGAGGAPGPGAPGTGGPGAGAPGAGTPAPGK